MHQLCLERINYAQRDLAHFQQYGYSADRLKRFGGMCERFLELPNDDELVGDQMVVTEKKYRAADALRAAIRSLMTRVALKFNQKSGRYRKFGTSKLGDMTDAQLIFCARRVVRVARQQIDFLADMGVNEDILRRITEAARVFENAVNIQQDKISDRDIAVERRVELANQLYEELVAICDIGKDIWNNQDASKYEQYKLYDYSMV